MKKTEYIYKCNGRVWKPVRVVWTRVRVASEYRCARLRDQHAPFSAEKQKPISISNAKIDVKKMSYL